MQKQKSKTLKRGGGGGGGARSINGEENQESSNGGGNGGTPNRSSSLERPSRRGASEKSFGSVKNGVETSSTSSSPKSGKKVGSGEDSYVTSADLERVKKEILTEMRMEMARMKEEVLAAIRDMDKN